MGKIFVSDHPVVKSMITVLLSETTSVGEFRRAISDISMLLCYEAFRNAGLDTFEVKTPMGMAEGVALSDKMAVTVPILRAGLGMTEGILRLLPDCGVGLVGMYRNEETLIPVEYYCKLPSYTDQSLVIVTDPMLATGGSASDAVDLVKEKGGKRIILLCVIAAPEGIEKFSSRHPDVDIFCACLDSGLNDRGYIVPGLGDAGDRIFGTV